MRVRETDPPGHVRTPVYVRGHRGVVERVVGDFPNPEELAYGRDGLPERALYRVRFSQEELWGEGTDTVEVEIYENWLEAP